MVEFAWMRSGSEAVGGSSVAVAEPPLVLPEPAALEFVYNPWKLKELRRLYINLADGTKVGYLDLATLDAVPESVGNRQDAGARAGWAVSICLCPSSIQAAQTGETAPPPTTAAPVKTGFSLVPPATRTRNPLLRSHGVTILCLPQGQPQLAAV